MNSKSNSVRAGGEAGLRDGVQLLVVPLLQAVRRACLLQAAPRSGAVGGQCSLHRWRKSLSPAGEALRRRELGRGG